MSKKKKSKKRIGKVNGFLYAIVYAFLKRRYTKKYNISYDKSAVKDIKGPAIVVATHTCDVDHILSALTLYPIRPTYIVSEHFIHNKKTARLLKLMHVITKKMFTPDVSTIRNILRAKSENAVIVIFPEGRLSCFGRTLPITEGTAELIKKLGVNLYAWRAEGAYLTFPKWRDSGDARCGKINASVKLLLSSEEVGNTDTEDIKRIVGDAIFNDDELSMAGVEYKCPDIARGVDKIIYKCPVCMKEGEITSGNGHIRCTCGLDATLDNFYRLKDAPFERVNEWFEWQQNAIDLESSMSAKARFGSCDTGGFMDPNSGEGEIYIDKHEFKLSGTLHGEPISFSVPTEKIGAFPATPRDHFDIYHLGELIYIYPEPDPRLTVKWVSYLDKFNSERKAQATTV